MAVFKCKMCGGSLEIQDGTTVCECEFCGSKQTLPSVKNEDLQALFNRANVLRMKSEFDKAADLYEKILQKNEEEAEAYWGLILCKYGIEYVEDPVTFKRVPTCHRASYDVVTADEDYHSAVKYANETQRQIYKAEAAKIDEIQKGILLLAKKEEPYDVFICYKETDELGARTQDSVIANDIYHQLTQEGFKVFYAAITLEDKLGTEYEPYIFAALNSAKVMLALGTKQEYFNAVWVKNEWSRFLKILQNDRSKLLIPCYRDMDVYELPEEFAHLQAQDMAKIGFMQDLIRGIKKVIQKETEQPKKQDDYDRGFARVSCDNQVKRGNMALDDHEWSKAEEYFEQALNADSECAEAYIGKMLANEQKNRFYSWTYKQENKYHSASTERVEACTENTEHIESKVQEFAVNGYLPEETIRKEYAFNRSYDSALAERKRQKTSQMFDLEFERLFSRAREFAKGDLKEELERAVTSIEKTLDDRIELAQKADEESIAKIKADYEAHIAEVDQRVEAMSADAKNRREQDYQNAKNQMEKANNAKEYHDASQLLMALNGYQDSNALAEQCLREIDRLKEEQKRAKKKKNRIGGIVLAAVVVCVAAFFVVTKVIIPNNKYNAAVTLMENGDYEGAITAFEALGGYKDSADQINNCNTAIIDENYNNAVALMNNGKYEEAIDEFEALGGYKDSADQINNCNTAIIDENYNNAVVLMNNGKYEEAIDEFEALGGYKDSDGLKVKAEISIIAKASIGDNITFGNYNGNTEWIVLAKEDGKILVVSKYALEKRRYNTEFTLITWEKCTIRSWLNGKYLSSAFSSDEQARIIKTSIANPDNASYGSDDGNNTTDKVFLLSIDEVNKYFSSYSELQAALADGTPVWWWLRSPGYNLRISRTAAYVLSSGVVYRSGNYVDDEDGAVRPALWIDISNL